MDDSRHNVVKRDLREPRSVRPCWFQQNEAGVVLTLTPAIVLVALIFIFFGIGASQLQRFVAIQDSAARLAANAAFRAHTIAIRNGTTVSTAVQAAANKAVEDAYSNSSNLFTLGPDTISLSVYPQTNGTHGVVTGGRWHYSAPVSCTGLPSPCPCNAGTWAGPCFQPFNNLNPDVNAYRIELKTRTANPFTTGVSNVLSALQVPLQTSATMSERTVAAMVLMDLSRSSHNETHIPYDGDTANLAPSAGYASESSFEITNTGCGVGNTNPCVRIPPAPSPAPTIPLCDGQCVISAPPFPENDPVLNPYNVLWNAPCRPNPSPSPTAAPPVISYRFHMRSGGGSAMTDGRRSATLVPGTKHYQSDFSCYRGTFTEAAGGGRAGNFLVDTYQGPTSTGTYDGPEPYTTMLSGINSAITAMREREAHHDRFGFIGFDKSATVTQRTVSLRTPFNTTDLFEATDVSNQTAAALVKRYEQFSLMIRPEGSTNLPAALLQAHQQLTSLVGGEFERIVVLISDGITNCTAEGACGGTQADYDASIAQAESIVQSYYVPDKIKLYWIHIGSRSTPHNLLVKSADTPTTCMQQDEADNHVPPLQFIDSSSAATYPESIRTTTSNFYNPMRLYSLIRQTRGRYIPIRTPCVAGTNITATLNTACAAATQTENPPGSGIPVPVVASPYTDAAGRLICEPSGESRREQMKKAMNLIFSAPHYMVDRIGARADYAQGTIVGGGG